MISTFSSLKRRKRLLAHGARPSLADVGLVGLGLGDALGQDLGVLVLQQPSATRSLRGIDCNWVSTHGLVLDLLGLASLESGAVALVLQTLGGDQPLDLGGLGVRLLALTLGLDLSSNDVLADLDRRSEISFMDSVKKVLYSSPPRHGFPLSSKGKKGIRAQAGPSHSLPGLPRPPPQLRAGDDRVWVQGETYIVILGEAEELADLGGALGAEALGVDDVGQAGDVAVALLDDAEGEDGQVHADDAAADRLALALAGAAGAVAGVAIGEQEADTAGVHDTLLHGETLLVVAAGDAEDVALELVADGVTRDLSAHLL